MERVFSKEINLLRKQSGKLAEASTLISADSNCDNDRGIWLNLCRTVWQEAENRRIDDLCITVTQNHLGFYERLLFEIIGKGRCYQSLSGIVAYPLRLQVGKARLNDKSHGGAGDKSLRKHFLDYTGG